MNPIAKLHMIQEEHMTLTKKLSNKCFVFIENTRANVAFFFIYFCLIYNFLGFESVYSRYVEYNLGCNDLIDPWKPKCRFILPTFRIKHIFNVRYQGLIKL